MPFEKGNVANPNGRPVGSKDKATMALREVVTEFVETNTPRFQEWLEEIKRDHGAIEAFKCVEGLIDYCLPKLQRSELTGKDGEKLSVTIKQITPLQKD